MKRFLTAALLVPASLLAYDPPNVLIIGDSISVAYTPTVIEALENEADVSRNPGNAQYTGFGVDSLDQWLGDTEWDVIHFNWGLWDLYGWKWVDEDRSVEAYEARLKTIVTRLQKTGADLIWATTTPVCPAPERSMADRWETDVVISPAAQAEYRAAAVRVMEEHGVIVNDLHGLIAPQRAEYAVADNDVHYTAKGSEVLGAQVVSAIREFLPPAPIAIDNQDEWKAASSAGGAVEIAEGFVTPSDASATFESTVQTFEEPRKLNSVTFTQSPIWENWEEIEDITPPGLGNAYVFLPIAPGEYYVFAENRGAVNGDFPKGVYHAWHSTDLKDWEHLGPVTNRKWVTTAEYANGKFYIYDDNPNDQDPHLLIDDDLHDGVLGKDMGMVLDDPSHGSDCGVLRDIDGTFHMIYENWDPINAKAHSWDSPLAGHASSEDGITGFVADEHPYAIDHRTEPTGEAGSYKHSSRKEPLEYEIHEPEQEAYGDYTLIRVGDQYHLFGDYHPAGKGDMCIARFSTDDLGKEFTWSGSIGNGFHPDPSVGFAEGQFYIVMQKETDFVSPGPWVDGVEARAGADTDGDGEVDQWTDWTKVTETYTQRPGFARVVDVAPAILDTSELPAASGFAFQFRTSALENGVLPIMDKVVLGFE